jgi:hypothetical protein
MSLRLAKKRSMELDEKEAQKDTNTAPPPKKRAKVVSKKSKAAAIKKKAPAKKKTLVKKKAPGRKKAAPKKKAPAKKKNSKKSKHEDYFDASSSDEDDSSSSDDDDDDDDDSSSSDDDDDDDSSSSDDDESDDDDDSSSSDDDDSDDEDSDIEYEDEYDEEFFLKDDPKDKEKLMAMTDVERQLVFEERRADRIAKMQQFNVEQRLRQNKKKEKEAAKQKKAGARRKSTRAQSKKTQSRKAALDNLLAKKKRGSTRSRMSDSSEDGMHLSSSSEDDDDEDYEYGGTLKRSGKKGKKKGPAKRSAKSSSSKVDDDGMDVDTEDVKQREQEDQPRMRYDAIVGSRSRQRKGIQLTRQDIYDDLHKPWFRIGAKGMFVKVRKQHGDRQGYMLMRIRDVYPGKKPYMLVHKDGLGSRQTSMMFNLELHAEATKAVKVRAKFISNEKCTEKEFNSFLKRLEHDHYPIPRQNEIDQIVHKYFLLKKDTSDADISKMIDMNKRYRKKAINISTAKIETQRELAVVSGTPIPENEVLAAERQEKIDELTKKIADLHAQEENTRSKRNERDLRTAKINERNQLGNILRMDHAKSQVQQQAEAGAINPFMRRATRPKILWDMEGASDETKKKDESKEETKNDTDANKKKEKEKIFTLYDLHNFSLPDEDNLPFTESRVKVSIDASNYNSDGSGKTGYGTKNRRKKFITGTISLSEYLTGNE